MARSVRRKRQPWQGNSPAARSYRRKGRERRRLAAPFSAIQAPYETVGDFESALRRRVGAQTDPLLNTVGEERRDQTSRHTGRTRDLGSWYGAQAGNLAQAFQDTQAALNNIISTGASSSGQNQAALAAALRASQGQANQLMGTIGGGGGPSNQANILANAASQAEAGQRGLGEQAVARIAGAGEMRNVAGTGLVRAQEDEGRRFRNIESQLDQREREIRESIPGLTEQLRAAMLEQELNRQNLGFQQELGREEFGLKEEEFKENKRNLRFQQNLALQELGLSERQFRHQQDIDFGQLDLAAQELLAAQQGGSEGEREDAKLRAERFKNAVVAMTEFLKPKRGETRDREKARERGLNVYNREPQELYTILTKRIGLSRREAVQLIHSVKDRRFERFSTRKPRRRRAGEQIQEVGRQLGEALG